MGPWSYIYNLTIESEWEGHELGQLQEAGPPLIHEMGDLDRVEVVEESEIMIEPLAPGQKGSTESEMPLADAGGCVVSRLHQLGQREFIRMDPLPGIGTMHPCRGAHSAGVASGQQSRPGRTADRGRRVIVGKADSFPGEAIDSGGPNLGRAIEAEVIAALIVDKDDDDVGRPVPAKAANGRKDERQKHKSWRLNFMPFRDRRRLEARPGGIAPRSAIKSPGVRSNQGTIPSFLNLRVAAAENDWTMSSADFGSNVSDRADQTSLPEAAA